VKWWEERKTQKGHTGEGPDKKRCGKKHPRSEGPREERKKRFWEPECLKRLDETEKKTDMKPPR